MTRTLDPSLRRQLSERIDFYKELGIYDFYRHPVRSGQAEATTLAPPDLGLAQNQPSSVMLPIVSVSAQAVDSEESLFSGSKPEAGVSDPADALRIIREDLAPAHVVLFTNRAVSKSSSAWVTPKPA